MLQQLYHLAIHTTYLLRLMASHRNGEMHGQDGIRIDQQLVVGILYLGQLLCRTIGLTQEARTSSYSLLTDGGTSRTDACWVKLHLESRRAHTQLTGLYMTQLTITVAGLRPQFQLSVKITVQGRELRDDG